LGPCTVEGMVAFGRDSREFVDQSLLHSW
jgi:hypothetical protein